MTWIRPPPLTPAVIWIPVRGREGELRASMSHLGLRASTAGFLLSGERRCGDCGEMRPLSEWAVDRSKPSGFSSRCKVCQREKAKAYYAAHRDEIREKAAAKRGAPVERTCLECGDPLEGRRRVVCGKSKCREARFRRLHPESWAAREAAKVERRREARRRVREAA